MVELSDRQKQMLNKIVKLMALGGGACFMEEKVSDDWREESTTFYWQSPDEPEAFKVESVIDLDTLHSLGSYFGRNNGRYNIRNHNHNLVAKPDAWKIYKEMLADELLEYLWKFKQEHPDDYQSLPSASAKDLNTSEQSFREAMNLLAGKGYIAENRSVPHPPPPDYWRLYITEEGEKALGKPDHKEAYQGEGTQRIPTITSSQQVALPPVDWSFIRSDKLRQLIQSDYDELQSLADSERLVAKSVIVLLGSLLEATLLDTLQARSRDARLSYWNIYIRGKNQRLVNPARKAVDANPQAAADIKTHINQALISVPGYDKWKLTQMIEVAEDMGLLNQWAKAKAHNVRETRNLIHPLVAMSEAPPSTKDVSTIIDLFESVINQLSQKKS